MGALVDVIPTGEQLALFSRVTPGVEVIRGAAGSGKTTTAFLKLRACVGLYLNRARRQVNPQPVRVLVLTYNRTLRGYWDIEERVLHCPQVCRRVRSHHVGIRECVRPPGKGMICTRGINKFAQQ